jgi:hypothetical protein
MKVIVQFFTGSLFKTRGLSFITPLAPLTLRGGNVEINLG